MQKMAVDRMRLEWIYSSLNNVVIDNVYDYLRIDSRADYKVWIEEDSFLCGNEVYNPWYISGIYYFSKKWRMGRKICDANSGDVNEVFIKLS